jgi:hypothetical protein
VGTERWVAVRKQQLRQLLAEKRFEGSASRSPTDTTDWSRPEVQEPLARKSKTRKWPRHSSAGPRLLECILRSLLGTLKLADLLLFRIGTATNTSRDPSAPCLRGPGSATGGPEGRVSSGHRWA